MAKLSIPFNDYAGQPSTARLPVADGISDVLITTLFDAAVAMSIGAAGQSTLDISAAKDAGPGGNAATKQAQIESKWLVSYHDSVVVTDEYTLEIPCPDASLLAAGTDNMELGSGAGATLKTQLEATCVAPNTGNTIVVDEVVRVGRNL